MAVIRKPPGLNPYRMPNPSPNHSTHGSKARTYWLKVKRSRLGEVSNRSGVPCHRQSWPFWFKRMIYAPGDGMPQIRYPAYPSIFCARPERCISCVQHLLQRIEILRPCYSIIQHGLEGDLNNDTQRTKSAIGRAATGWERRP
jgi:hypothetical protein